LTPFSVSQIHHTLALTTAAQSNDLSHISMDNVEYHWYKDNKFPVMCWSASAFGFFSKLASGAEQKPMAIKRYGWLQENYRRFERVKQLSEELNIPIGTLVLSYLMSDQDVPTSAVVSFSKPEQFKEAMEAVNVQLTREQRNFLEGTI
jgi:aryl-alcohol dehydrogenase-like predicted oxidoreductase